jgi:hypothetical protein
VPADIAASEGGRSDAGASLVHGADGGVRHEADLVGLHHAEVVHGSPVQPVEFGDNDGVILPNEVESRTRVAYSKMETPKRRVA